jgi:DNA repair exonuclease SbcCD ATPase subunit
MGVYFSERQLQDQDFRAPDFFAVLDGVKRERKSWVVWQEDRSPDVVIELLSESTEAVDKGEKKRVYQDRLRVPEYFWYDPFGGELAGFRLMGGRYKPIRPDKQGRLRSERLGLLLGRVEGTSYLGLTAPWLRWMTDEGQVLPTQQEIAEQERQHAEQERQHAEQERQHAEQERQHAEQERQRAEQERQRAEQERQHAEQERQRAEQERQRAEQAEARVRRLEEELQSLRTRQAEPPSAPSSAQGKTRSRK